MKIVLIGYMGSGKSAVGRLLASELDLPFKDLDDEIENEEGTKISNIFSEKGVIYFRKSERNILKSIVESENDLILATGGGTPCYGDVMNLLKSNKEIVSIYLMTSINTLSNRIFQERNKRPIISNIKTKDDLNDFIAKHLFERSSFYNQASFTIKTDDLKVEDVVKKIIEKLNYSKKA